MATLSTQNPMDTGEHPAETKPLERESGEEELSPKTSPKFHRNREDRHKNYKHHQGIAILAQITL